MSHSNEFWNFGNADRSEDNPKGYFTPLFPHNLGRPLHHPEQDYNAHLISQIVKGFRVIGSGDDGVMTTDDLEMGIKLHEIDPSDADYLHYIACGCKDEEWIWVPAEMGGTATSPFNVTAYATDINPCNSGVDAVITAQGMGGTVPYLYSLQTSPNINPGNISDWNTFGSFSHYPTINDPLNDSTNYYVYGKDALNTIDIAGPININTIVPLEITLSHTDATQPNGVDGTITVNVTGGVGAYTYNLYQGNNQITPSYGLTNLEEYTFGNPDYSISAGDYTVEVIDSSTGCIATEDVTVSQPLGLSFNYTINNATCAGYPHASNPVLPIDDSFTFENVTGATAPYEYSITDPNTTGYTWVATTEFEVPNPGGGNNVTIYPAVKDATGYIYETPGGVTFYDPDPYGDADNGFTFDVLGVAASCNGNNQGSIIFSDLTGGPDVLHWTGDEYWQFSVDDGTNWAPAFPTPFHETSISTSYEYTGLPEGEYICRIRRVYENSPGVWIAACSSDPRTVIVDPANSVDFSVSATDDSICGTGGDGSLIINGILIGGQNASLDYTVTWVDVNGNNPGSQTGNQPDINIENLDAGTYSVTITDNDPGGCDKTEIVTIGQTQNNLEFNVAATGEISCGGNTNISYSYSGATGPITIYDVTDPTNTLAQGPAPIGSGLLTISSAGTYVFEIKDSATQCTLQRQTEITEVIQAVNLISQIDPSCGADGSIEIDVTNTTGEEYQLALVGSAAGTYQSSGSFTGLDGGDYIISIQNDPNDPTANLCNSLTYTFTLADAVPLTATVLQIIDVTCYGGIDGGIAMDYNGPVTSSVSYLWSSESDPTFTATTPSLNNIPPGRYTVVYTDNDTGCFITEGPIQVNEPDELIGNEIVIATVGCPNNSFIQYSATGGTPTYTYEFYSNSIDPANLVDTQVSIANGEMVQFDAPHGDYVLLITDTNGCSIQHSFALPPCQAQVSFDSSSNSQITCNGGNGTVTITASGGSGNYQFSEDNMTWTSTFSGDPYTHTYNGPYSGGTTHIFYVRDADDIAQTDSISHTLSHPDPITATILPSTDESVTGSNDGAVNFENIIGGSSTYATVELYDAPTNVQIGSISSPVQNTPYVFSGLTAGNYYIIITDDNGCESDKILSTIGSSDVPLTISSATSGNIACFGGTTDVITTVSNGSGTFRFSNDGGTTWTGYLTQNTYTFSGLSAGSYSIAVEDQQTYSGNPVYGSITLTEPGLVTNSFITINESIQGENDGSITITVSGGIPEYGVQVNDANGNGTTLNGTGGQTQFVFSNLAPGAYTILGGDANSCPISGSFTITGGTPQINATINPGTILCHGGAADMVMTTSDGSGDYQYAATPTLDATPPTNWNATTQDTTYTWSAGAGLKYYWVKDAVTGTEISVAHTETQPDPIGVSYNGAETYPGADDASIQIFIDGGTPAYTAKCIETNELLTNLQDEAPGVPSGTFTTITGAGIYNIEITDANGCQKQSILTVTTTFDNISIDSVTSTPTCYGETDGIISFTASGGFGSTYEWSNDGGNTWTQDITSFDNLAAADYDIFLRDYSTGETLEWSSNPVVVVEADEIQVITSTMTDGTCSSYPSYTMTFSGSNITQSVSNQKVKLLFTSPTSSLQFFATITATGTPNVYQADYTSAQFEQLDNFIPQLDLTSGTFNLEIESDDCIITHGPVSYSTSEDIVLTVNLVSQPECPSDVWTYEASATGGTNTTYKLMTAPNSLITTWDGSLLQFTLPQTVSASTAILAQDIDFANNGCQSNVVVADTRTVSELIVNGSVSNPNCATSGGSTYSFTITGGLPGGTTNNTYKYKVSTDGGSTYPGTVYDYTGAVGPVGISDGDIYIKAYRIVDTNSTEGNCDVEEGIGQVTNPIALSGSIDSGSTSGPTACQGAGATGGQIAMTVTGGTGTYEFSYDGGNNWYTLTETSPGSGTYKFTGLTAGVYGIVAQDTNGCIAFTDTVTLSAPNSPVVQSHKIEGCWRDADGASVRTEVSVANNGNSNSAGLYTFTDTTADAPTTNTTGVFTYSNSDMTTHVQAPITITEISTQCYYVMNSFNFTAVPSLTSSGVIGNFNNTPSGNPTGTYDTDDFKVWNIGSAGNTGYGGPYTVELIDSNGNVFGTINNATSGNNYIYDIPSGDYTYKIYDNTGLTGCGRTYNTPMTSTQQVLNEETFYHIHAGGGNVAPYGDLMSTTATWYTSAGAGTQDINAIMLDMIDNGNGTTYSSGVTMPDVGTFEFAGPITGNNCGQTWTHNASSGQNYYYLAVPNNSSFTENLVTDGVFQFQCNGLTSYANARRAFTYNGESYWLYKLVSGTGSSADQYGFK
mgnify:CR=1 FL=1